MPSVYEQRWRILAILSVVQFMLFLDDTIVNVALPSIREDLGFSTAGLAWVINAYVLAFGGFLLLGGRLADALGRRRVFLWGLVLFAAGSLLNAIAFSTTSLVASRGVQGLGSALVAPAALSIVAVLFTDARERARALAIWSGLAGGGAATGVVLSGVITDLISWRWVFYINLPVALAAFVLVTRLVRFEERPRSGRFDVAGAFVGTTSVLVLVYTLLTVENHGWVSLATLAGFAATALLGALFVRIERTAPVPLVPAAFLAAAPTRLALVLQHLLSAVLFGGFFLLTLYMQGPLGFSPLVGGLAWLGFFLGLFVGFGSAEQLITKVGVQPIMVGGLIAAAVGLLWLTRLPVDGHYWIDIFPGMVIFAFGLGWGYVPVAVTIIGGAREEESGLAAGLVNVGQQLGGALGIAILVGLANARSSDLLAQDASAAAAQVAGAHLAFAVGAGLCVVGALLALRWIVNLKPASLPHHVAPGTE
jgi:EmrB/QacA subfamily drug resistance transporter